MKNGVFEAVIVTYPTPAPPLKGRGVRLSPTPSSICFEEEKCGYKILEDVTNRKKKRHSQDKRK